MWTIFDFVLKLVGGAAVLTAAMAVLARIFIEHRLASSKERLISELAGEREKAKTEFSKEVEVFKLGLDKDIESFKATLTKSASLDVEAYKAQLQRAAAEHQVRFASIYERSLTVMAELYAVLVVVHRNVATYFHPVRRPGHPEQIERALLVAAQDAFREFRDQYGQNAIFLDSRTCGLIDDLLKKYFDALIDFSGREHAEDATKRWNDVLDTFESDIAASKRQLEERFRDRLGVE